MLICKLKNSRVKNGKLRFINLLCFFFSLFVLGLFAQIAARKGIRCQKREFLRMSGSEFNIHVVLVSVNCG